MPRGLPPLWLVLLFASFGLFAPRHVTCVVVLLLSAAAASGAVLLIIELETPNTGFVHLSPDPLLHAIDVMDKHATLQPSTHGPGHPE